MPILSPTVNAHYYSDGSYTIPRTGILYIYIQGGSGAGGQSNISYDGYGNFNGQHGGSGRSGALIYATPTLNTGDVVTWSIGGAGTVNGAGGASTWGYYGGNAGGDGGWWAGSGGGATAVNINGSLWAVAAGGGGGGGVNADYSQGEYGQAASSADGVHYGANGGAGRGAGGGGGGGVNGGNGGSGTYNIPQYDGYGRLYYISSGGGQAGGNGGSINPGSLSYPNGVGSDSNGNGGYVRLIFIPNAIGNSALPSTTLSLNDIQNQFGGTNPISESEYYVGGGYVQSTDFVPNVPTSGTISIGQFLNAKKTQLYQQIFTGSATWTAPDTTGLTMEVFVVGGGGGGGGVNGGGTNGGAGAGGGGIAYHPTFPVLAGVTYTIAVGAGGGVRSTGAPSYLQGNGNTIYAYGGGAGAWSGTGGAGGSGGGGAGNAGHGNFTFQYPGGSASQGFGGTQAWGNAGGSSYFFDGGDGTNFTPAGGGGGGGAAGGSWGYPAGGVGLFVDKFQDYAGVNGYFAGGGGGGAFRSALTFTPVGAYPGGYGGGAPASTYYTTNGTPNTGGGGGGTGGGEGFGSPGPSSGGSGIIIIRYYA